MNTLLLTAGSPIGTYETQAEAPLLIGGSNLTTGSGAPIDVITEQSVTGPIPFGPQWDLCLDAFGNIAVASGAYALAQDAASAIRTFAGEVWYDSTQGIPYFAQVLGKSVPLALIKSLFEQAALTVPGVVSATAYITGLSNRTLTGQVQITDQSGATASVGF